MELSKIKNKKMRGDLKIASQIVGISQFNASNALQRPGSKYHTAVAIALIKIIENRERLLSK